MTQGLGSGWAALADDLERELQALDPPGELLDTEIDAVGLLRFRVKLDRRVRAEGKRLVRAYQARAAEVCEECGHEGRIRVGNVLMVWCDGCVPGPHQH